MNTKNSGEKIDTNHNNFENFLRSLDIIICNIFHKLYLINFRKNLFTTLILWLTVLLF